MRTLALWALGLFAASCGRHRAVVGTPDAGPLVDGGSSSSGGGAAAPKDAGTAGGAAGGAPDGGATCSPLNCANGCCTATGVCITATTTDRCGNGAARCQACSAGNTCVAKACMPCAGCVDATTGRCRVGFADDACGQGGAICQSCDSASGQRCTAAGQCLAGGTGGGASGAGGGVSGAGGGVSGAGGGVSGAGGGVSGTGGGVSGTGGGSSGGYACDPLQLPPGNLSNNQLMPDGGLLRLTGGLVVPMAVTSTVPSWMGAYPPSNTMDGDPMTAWYADTSSCSFVGRPEFCCQGVALTVTLPGPTQVNAIRLVGPRDFPTGYDPLSGMLVFLSTTGVEMGRAPFVVRTPEGDWGSVLGAGLANVGGLRIEFEWSEGSGPGLAEIQVFSLSGLPVVDGGYSVGDVSWVQSAAIFRSRPGVSVNATCPAQGQLWAVWGTDVYTDDSSVCSAAVHAGVITAATGGPITFQTTGGLTSYVASSRNGVQSLSYGPYTGSFCFGCSQSDAGVPGYQAGAIGWTTTAVIWPVPVGGVAEATCLPGTPAQTIWGTTVYTDDSAVCVAALHDGRISLSGGQVRLQMLAGQPSYQGSARNGVTSSSWASHPRSYSFLP